MKKINNFFQVVSNMTHKSIACTCFEIFSYIIQYDNINSDIDDNDV